MKHLHSLTKKPAFRHIFLLVTVAILVTACVPSLGTAVVETNSTTVPNPSATAGTTRVTSTPEPATETPSSTPTAASVPATETPAPPTPWPEPGLPVLGSFEAPPVSGCVVFQSGRVIDEELPYVRSGPGLQFGVIGQLGRDRWANGLQVQGDWYEIIVGPGATGWVQAAGVGSNGQCEGSTDPVVPTIMNRGAPANGRCVAMRPAYGAEAPPVYQAATPESSLIARLGNWADVHEITPAWYSVSLPEVGNGWVSADQVELNMGCGVSGPIRTQFPVGATGTTIEGKLPGQIQVAYLFWAAEGQLLDISVTSPENSVLFHVEGVRDGQVVKHLLDGETGWQGTVPASQDYLLTLDNVGNVATYTIHLSIESP